VSEIDDAGYSLDRARDALNWFGAYVPKSLIRRIMEAGEAGLVSRKQLVTVMFTDIVQFSQLTRNMPGDEVADLLNHHFTLLGACIERERGVVDKFIGDAVMAVWGGIGGLVGHADSAVRAALAIARALEDDDVARRHEGRPPIRVRIGIHSGPVVAGNIGSADRVNYTVVGDTVNVAQRLEQVAKEFMVTDEVVTVLVSTDTIAALKDPSLVAQFGGEPIVCQGKTGDDVVKCLKLSLPSRSVISHLED
jgi:class 3 adenylate cyclase